MLPSILPSLNEICKNRPLFAQLEFTKKTRLIVTTKFVLLSVKKRSCRFSFCIVLLCFLFSDVVLLYLLLRNFTETIC